MLRVSRFSFNVYYIPSVFQSLTLDQAICMAQLTLKCSYSSLTMDISEHQTTPVFFVVLASIFFRYVTPLVSFAAFLSRAIISSNTMTPGSSVSPWRGLRWRSAIKFFWIVSLLKSVLRRDARSMLVSGEASYSFSRPIIKSTRIEKISSMFSWDFALASM